MAASPDFPKVPDNWSEFTELLPSPEISIRIFEKKNVSVKKNILFMVHGFGEQSDRYEHFPFYLENEVDLMILPDLPGHGLSYGQRGHCENIGEFFQTLELAWNFARQKYARDGALANWTWFAHSFGALISLAFLHEHKNLPLTQAIFSAPLIDVSMPVPVIKKTIGKLIAPILGSLSLSNEIQGDVISSLPQVGEEYLRNPLNHSKVTPTMYKEMTALMAEVKKSAWEFAYPVHFLLPQSDRLVNWQSAYDFALSLKMKSNLKKHIENWPEGNHETFNDVDRERIFNALSSWIRGAA